MTAVVARRWAELNRERPLPVVDALIGATALAHDAVLVTRDVGALAGTPVPLLDPFADDA